MELEQPTYHTTNNISPVKILSDSSGLSAYPADQLEWIEVVLSMAQENGVERTTEVMRSNCIRWSNTKNKSGKSYRKTDLRWIAWAQEELAASPADYSDVDINTLTGDELMTELKRRVEAQK